MSGAGFVLAGGRSTRMGRDKALLARGQETLIEHVARCLDRVVATVTIVGAPERYSVLGWPVIADCVDAGPLGGVYTALRATKTEWNLIAACDMPGVTAGFFKDLLDAAARTPADCVVPRTAGGLHPLCAAYRRGCAARAEAMIARKILKMHDFISFLQVEVWPVGDAALLANINTPEQWSALK